MHHSNRKSPDKAALDPSLLFSSCILKPDVDHVVYCMFVFNVFLLKYKHVFLCFLFQNLCFSNYGANRQHCNQRQMRATDAYRILG